MEKVVTSPTNHTLAETRTVAVAHDGAHIHRTVLISLVLFVTSFFLLFLGMRRYPLPYDEGVVLTAAMRVAAGQVPHRDFYAIYGPADFYLPAALFKMFGPSLLIVRLLDLFVEAITFVVMFIAASSYCRRSVAVCTTLVTFLWIYGLNAYISSTVFPVALLSFASSILLIPLFARRLTRTRLCAAGAIAGLAALYRYDTGVALLAVQVCVIAIAGYFRHDATSKRLSIIASALWPYMLGFTILTVPAIVYFLSVSSIYPLVYDVVNVTAHYKRYRGMPFPRIHLKKIDDLAVYGPIVTIILSSSMLLIWRPGSEGACPKLEGCGKKQLSGLLITMSLLTFVMYFKGYVRAGTLNMFISLLPSLFLTAVLFEYRNENEFPRLARILVSCLAFFFIFTASFCAAKAARFVLLQGSIPDRIVRVVFASGNPSPEPGPAWCKISNPVVQGFCKLEDDDLAKPSPEAQSVWCKTSNPLTRGFCFLVDDGRMRTIEFIESHTQPDQRIFVGLSRHDRTIGSDNLIYFATQRLPATKWSQFDPGLQNSYPIQSEMIGELKIVSAPYIILDSEFDSIYEPNESSISSGVTLLDDFIHSKYRYVQSFGEMSIWQVIAGTDDRGARNTPGTVAGDRP